MGSEKEKVSWEKASKNKISNVMANGSIAWQKKAKNHSFLC